MKKTSDVEKKVFAFEVKMNKMCDYQIDPNYIDDSLSELEGKTSELEDRSHRNNIGVDGLTEEKGETWKDCKKRVLEILRDKLEIEDVPIEGSHRVKPDQNKKDNKGKASPSTVVCKTRIVRKCNCLKGASYYINEDFSKETLALPIYIWRKVKAMRGRSIRVFRLKNNCMEGEK